MTPPLTRVFAHHEVENTGSAARDFCMLERNLLSHLKLALLLSLLSSSLILRARLVPDPTDHSSEIESKASLPLASVQLAAALVTIVAGYWEYESGCRDLRSMTAFLVGVKPHLALMSVVVAAIFATCIVLLAGH
ncbi:hypothetical protein LshimejAT787_1004240 [Lyophyllum shimeji]|uniref:DUF202 domain-containing protein n=1 Tax=Lyophyllum shimeji TaxID=47721 RepID=A0A9P3PUK2_LYOSH|nr:hypothetical protein LshimejAT787_1004240 [Lyophyllum shimeji]